MVASIWRDIVDLSPAADTPARAKVGVQLGTVIAVLGVVAVVVLELTGRWRGAVDAVLIIAAGGAGLAVGSTIRLRRLRRARRRARPTRRRDRRDDPWAAGPMNRAE